MSDFIREFKDELRHRTHAAAEFVARIEHKKFDSPETYSAWLASLSPAGRLAESVEVVGIQTAAMGIRFGMLAGLAVNMFSDGIDDAEKLQIKDSVDRLVPVINDLFKSLSAAVHGTQRLMKTAPPVIPAPFSNDSNGWNAALLIEMKQAIVVAKKMVLLMPCGPGFDRDTMINRLVDADKQLTEIATRLLEKADVLRGLSDATPAQIASAALQIADPKAPYFPPQHFKLLYGIPGSRLREARSQGRLAAQRSGANQWNYSEPDAERLWPDEVTRT